MYFEVSHCTLVASTNRSS